MDSTHRALIREQFTRQAVPFANAPAIRNAEMLDRIVDLSDAVAVETLTEEMVVAYAKPLVDGLERFDADAIDGFPDRGGIGIAALKAHEFETCLF